MFRNICSSLTAYSNVSKGTSLHLEQIRSCTQVFYSASEGVYIGLATQSSHYLLLTSTRKLGYGLAEL